MSERALIIYLALMFGAIAISSLADSCAQQACLQRHSPEQCK